MDKTFLSFALVIVGLGTVVAPVSGFAYLSPEQVFGGQTSDLRPAPPTLREGEAVIQEQQHRAASSRAAVQKAELTSIQDQPEPVDTFVPDNSAKPLNLFDENAAYERRQERIQNEKSSGPTIIISGGDGTITDGNGNVLHSGAPRITATGPESVLAIAAIILAAISTMLYAQVRARRMTLSA